MLTVNLVRCLYLVWYYALKIMSTIFLYELIHNLKLWWVLKVTK